MILGISAKTWPTCTAEIISLKSTNCCSFLSSRAIIDLLELVISNNMNILNGWLNWQRYKEYYSNIEFLFSNIEFLFSSIEFLFSNVEFLFSNIKLFFKQCRMHFKHANILVCCESDQQLQLISYWRAYHLYDEWLFIQWGNGIWWHLLLMLYEEDNRPTIVWVLMLFDISTSRI